LLRRPTLTALVTTPLADQSIWKVHADKPGDFEIRVSTSGKLTQKQRLSVAGKGLFD